MYDAASLMANMIKIYVCMMCYDQGSPWLRYVNRATGHCENLNKNFRHFGLCMCLDQDLNVFGSRYKVLDLDPYFRL